MWGILFLAGLPFPSSSFRAHFLKIFRRRRAMSWPSTEGPTLNLAMDGVVLEDPEPGVIGSEVRQRIFIYVLHSKNIVLM